MKTTALINNTHISIELGSYDENLHDEFLSSWFDRYSLPYCVAHISLVADEKIEPLKDELLAFVKIDLIDNIKPKLAFRVVDVKENNNGFTPNFRGELLKDFSSAVYHHELEEQ